MDKPFAERLEAVRFSDDENLTEIASGYQNGQVSLTDDDASNWDNFDRYYKFFNISAD